MDDKVIATNRQARFNYSILESLEAGIQLMGTEVKSLRAAKASLADSFARPEANEIFLHNLHIPPYEFGNIANVDPVRPRKLLLHKREIIRLANEIATKKLALIPLKMYLKNGIVKVEMSLAKGKKMHDKRDAIRTRESNLEMRRELHKRN